MTDDPKDLYSSVSPELSAPDKQNDKQNGEAPNNDSDRDPNHEHDRMESLLLSQAGAGTCPPLDILFAADSDVLPASAATAVREHIAHCALCRTVLSELDPAAQSLSPAANERIRARIQARQTRTSFGSRLKGFNRAGGHLFAIAAILLLGVLGIFSYRLLHTSAGEHPSVATNKAPATPAPVEIAELHQIAPLAPPDDVPALVTRGAAAGHGPSVNDLMPAFRAYNQGDFAQAAAAFTPLVTRFPQSDIPPLYLGISQLQLEHNANAQRSLHQALLLAGPARHEAAVWYLAVADLRLAQPHAAVPLLHELCSQPHSAYAPRACALEKHLGPA